MQALRSGGFSKTIFEEVQVYFNKGFYELYGVILPLEAFCTTHTINISVIDTGCLGCFQIIKNCFLLEFL